ncbi:hypothetical protein ACIRPT_21150 [Streptomyces sp. NPDC101227]|uniref:hypothetical protein n=1 Tax=Streptomyces sp. NPDC101227 TaxID=3366136 RepID=UPI0037FB7AC8
MSDPFLAALSQATRTVVARVRGELSAAAATTTATALNDKIAHFYCCEPDQSLCGLDLSDTPPSKDGEQDCVVCTDLDENDAGCPLC